jgi:hypothetical protein
MGGDIKGGGMTYYEAITTQNPNLVYGEGLRVPANRSSLELDGLGSLATMGKKKGFERVLKIN